jgi:hypothetical protein
MAVSTGNMDLLSPWSNVPSELDEATQPAKAEVDLVELLPGFKRELLVSLTTL